MMCGYSELVQFPLMLLLITNPNGDLSLMLNSSMLMLVNKDNLLLLNLTDAHSGRKVLLPKYQKVLTNGSILLTIMLEKNTTTCSTLSPCALLVTCSPLTKSLDLNSSSEEVSQLIIPLDLNGSNLK